MAVTRFITSLSNLFLNSSSKTISVLSSEIIEHYRFESERLKSFEKWSFASINPTKLAAAGFYYTGRNDTVKCFECKIEMNKWQQNDDPMLDHRRWSKNCRFVHNISCGNVPIGEGPKNKIPSIVPEGYDECGAHKDENYTKYQQMKRKAIADIYGVKKIDPHLATILPIYPEFILYDNRLSTYHRWPKTKSQTKEDMAAAGWFYTGKDDETICYYCGGGVKGWVPEDDPWEEHIRWYKYCPYLYMIKGRDHVNRISDKIHENMMKSFVIVEDQVDQVDKKSIKFSTESKYCPSVC